VMSSLNFCCTNSVPESATLWRCLRNFFPPECDTVRSGTKRPRPTPLCPDSPIRRCDRCQNSFSLVAANLSVPLTYFTVDSRVGNLFEPGRRPWYKCNSTFDLFFEKKKSFRSLTLPSFSLGKFSIDRRRLSPVRLFRRFLHISNDTDALTRTFSSSMTQTYICR